MTDNTFNPLTFDSFSLPVADIVTLVFLVVLGGYVIFTAIFYYHWQQYSLSGRVTFLTYIAYIATTLPLIAALGLISLSL